MRPCMTKVAAIRASATPAARARRDGAQHHRRADQQTQGPVADRRGHSGCQSSGREAMSSTYTPLRVIEESSGLSTPPTPRLTSFARGAGCGCKLPAAELHALLGDLPVVADERVLVGFAGGDDAAVVRVARTWRWCRRWISSRRSSTTRRQFGAIAAANALSDVYAMGGRPISALSIVAFPLERLGGDVLRAVLEGALDTLAAAGVALVGGHSIDDPEPKFGLAVTGLVDPARILRNDGARAGDVARADQAAGDRGPGRRTRSGPARTARCRGGGGDAHAQRRGGPPGTRRRGPRGDRRDRVRAARARARHGARERRRGGARGRCGSGSGGRCRPAGRRATGSPAARAATRRGRSASPPSAPPCRRGGAGCCATRPPPAAWSWRWRRRRLTVSRGTVIGRVVDGPAGTIGVQ